MEIRDDRTEAQKTTHDVLVIATDRFMSGWGRAAGGVSIAAWACRGDDAGTVESWVRSRHEMHRVRVTCNPRYKPRTNGCAHFHIYAVGPEHPALRGPK